MEPWTNSRVLQMNQRCSWMSNLGIMHHRAALADLMVDVTKDSMKSVTLSLSKMVANSQWKNHHFKTELCSVLSILCCSCCTKLAEYLITGLMQMLFNVKKENDRVAIVGSEIISCCPLADYVKNNSLPHVQHNDFIFSLGMVIDSVKKKLDSLTVHHMQTIQPKYQWLNKITEEQELWECKHTLSWRTHSLFLAVKVWKPICYATLSCCQVFL